MPEPRETVTGATSGGEAELAGALLDQLQVAFEAFERAIDGLTTDELNAPVGPDTNSIAVLVAHAIDTGRSILHDVVDEAIPRDRAAAFQITDATADDLKSMLAAWREEMDDLVARALALPLDRPIVRFREATKAWWLLHVLAHTREHAAHAGLTRQLVEGGGLRR